MSGTSRKRSRSSSEDVNNSFVMSVTNKVTSLLPTKITQWFSGSKSSQNNSNGSAPTAEVTDSSSEEEPELPSPVTQPPQKRARYNSSNIYNANETKCVTYNNEPATESSSYIGFGPSHLNKFTRDPNLVPTPVHTSDEATSPDRSERDDANDTNSSFSYSTLGPPVPSKRKSLFRTFTNNESLCTKPTNNTMVDSKQPCFKPNLLSPFYPTRTAYGGASSQYINQPITKQRKSTQVKQMINNTVAAMSQSARRVMDLLEDYSSPIMEAKRLPHIPPTKGPLETSSTLSDSFSNDYNKSLSMRKNEFRAPNIASILRLKQKSRLMNTTNAARQIIASHSSAGHYMQQGPSTSAPYKRSQSDVESRSKCVGTTSDSQPQTWTENKESPTLPPLTAVLQISKDYMPQFKFGTNLPNPEASSTPKASKIVKPGTVPEPPVSVAPNTALSKFEKPISKVPADCGETFTFSFPAKIGFTVGSPQEATTPPKFTFGSPERTIDRANEKTDKSICVVGEKDVIQTEIPKPKDWKCSDCWVMNKQDVDKCVCCGGKKPAADDKNIKCSVCKLANSQPNKVECVNCEKVKRKNLTSNNLNSTPLVNSVKSTKWKCSDCWVDNDDSKEKCVCCGCKNPKTSTPSTAAAPAKSVCDNDWTCDDCWIKNKSSVEKCAACGGTKPGSKQCNKPALPMSITPSAVFKPLENNTFEPLVVTQSNKWECISCLVRNDDDKIKCVCCETERPGTEKKIAKTTFNFGTPTANTFKFGIDPKVQEANLSRVPEIKPLETKVEESETNNNVLAKAPPTFSFGIPAKKSEDQIDNKMKKAAAPGTESPLVVQKTSMFKVPDFTVKKPEFKGDNEKPQEVPKVEFSLPATSKPESKPFGLLGASSLTSTPNATMFTMPVSAPTSTPSLLNPTANVEKKDTPSPQIPFHVSPNTGAATPAQSKFVFSGAGLKPAMNLFAKPASSPPTTSISFGSSAQSPPTTASSLFQKPPEQNTTSSMSLFQKSEPPTNSPLSLFQKPTAAATTTAPSLASTAPVFSFGTAAKPASTFSFGATQPANTNESTANSSFKFFGSTPDKNASTNKFNLGGVTNLGPSNPLGSGNILGSGGLSAGNALGSNSISVANSLTREMPVQSNQNDQISSIQSPTPSIFGSSAQKENMWSQSNNTSNNLFVANASNNLQKPGAFTFGSASTSFGAQPGNPAPSSTPFGAQPSNSAPTNTPFGAQPSNSAPSSTPFGAQPSNSAPSSTPFGAQSTNPATASTPFGAQSSNPAPASTPFGAQPSNSAPSNTPFGAQSSNPAPVFGSNAQSAQNLFGMGNHGSNSRSLFSSPVQSQPGQSLFGGSQTSTPNAMGMFGSGAAGAATSFGAPAQPMPSFDQSASAPQPAFSFGATPSQSPVVFGFGQQQQSQQQQPQQPIYNFGASTNSSQMGMGAAPNVQFSMGSAPAVRRVRKAVRRNTPR